MKVRLKLFFKWGIKSHEEYAVEENGNRKVAYVEKQEIMDGIIQKYLSDRANKEGECWSAVPTICIKGQLRPFGDRWDLSP